MWGRTAAISCFFFSPSFGLVLDYWSIKQKHVAHKSTYHLQTILLLQNVSLEAFIFFFIIFFFKVCTQNIKSASDQRSHRVGQCTSDQKSAWGGGHVWHRGTELIVTKTCAFVAKVTQKCDAMGLQSCTERQNMSGRQRTETWKTDSSSTQLVGLICGITQLDWQC